MTQRSLCLEEKLYNFFNVFIYFDMQLRAQSARGSVDTLGSVALMIKVNSSWSSDCNRTYSEEEV